MYVPSRTSKAWVPVPPNSDSASGRVCRLITSSRVMWEKPIFCGTNSSISALLTVVTALRILALDTLKMDDRIPLLKPVFIFIKKIPRLFLGLRTDVFFTLPLTWEKRSSNETLLNPVKLTYCCSEKFSSSSKSILEFLFF